MIKVIAKVLELVLAIIEIAKRAAKRMTERRHEEERAKIDDDPVDWMREHFGGVSGDDADDVRDSSKKADVGDPSE